VNLISLIITLTTIKLPIYKPLESYDFRTQRQMEDNPQPEARKFEMYAEFNTHTPPDIIEKTRIVALCGVLHEYAHPKADGWLVSDFFAFWHLLGGITEHQTWMHCLNLEALVAGDGRCLHGNPDKERKVVLDAGILDKALRSQHPPVFVDPVGLREEVVRRIREECVVATLRGEDVLILIIGHGHFQSHGVWLGGVGALEYPNANTLNLVQLKEAINGAESKVTLLTTHSFSGGWTCYPAVIMTAITAADVLQETISWRRSGLSGRYCGSIFTTIVIEKLTRYGDENRRLRDSSAIEDEEQEPNDEQTEAYSAFSKSVYQSLLEDVDRRGYEHVISFGSGDDDAWKMCWGERTGIPLAHFEQRWNRLQTWPAGRELLAGDPQDRDPRVMQEAKDEYAEILKVARDGREQYPAKKAHEATGSVLTNRETRALFGNNDESLIRIISSLGTQYLASYGPASDSGTDGGLSNTIQRISSGDERDMARVQRALTAIEYRMQTMATADRYLSIMQIERPCGQRCYEYDARGLLGRVDLARYRVLKGLLCAREILFPEPMGDQGQGFCKGFEYLIAAFIDADMAVDVVVRKVDALVGVLDGELEVEMERVERDSDVALKRRNLFHAFGRLRDMSPAERISRG